MLPFAAELVRGSGGGRLPDQPLFCGSGGVAEDEGVLGLPAFAPLEELLDLLCGSQPRSPGSSQISGEAKS